MSTSGRDAIIKELEERTKKKIEAMLADAEEKAENIIQEARRKAKQKAKHQSREKINELRRKLLDKAENERRRAVIKAKHEILEKVRSKAKEMLRAVTKGENPRYEYEEILYKLIKEAAENIGEKKIYISANAQDTNYLQKNLESIENRLEEHLTKISLIIQENELDCIGGIKAKNEEATKMYYNTLENRLVSYFDQLKPKINEILFGGMSNE